MRNLLPLLAIFLCSCGTYIDTHRGIVSTGFLSTHQASSGKMKCADGSSVVWSDVGFDGTSVPNNALGTISTVSAGNNLVKGVESNNLTKVQQANINSKTTLGLKKLDNEAAAAKGAQELQGKALDLGVSD